MFECNIQLFQNCRTMNCITFIPYYFRNNMPNTQVVLPQVSPQQPPILMYLSKALNISLQKYEKELLLQKQAKKQPINLTSEPLPPKQQEITLEPIKEETAKKNDNAIIQEKEKSKEKVEEKVVKVEKVNKIAVETVKAPKVSPKIEKEGQEKNVIQHRHKIKKEKQKHRKSGQSSKTPQICLIDTIACPGLGMSKELLRKKREKLLRRQVFDWNEKMKNFRDKRELRMLHC